MEDPRIEALLGQLSTLMLILERPVVQRQLLAFALIFLLSWLLPVPLGRLLQHLLDLQSQANRQLKEAGYPIPIWRSRFLRWARGLQLLIFPLVGIVASGLAARSFFGQGWPAGLLERLAILFWLILIYRVAEGGLFAWLETDTAGYYVGRFVRPLFAVLVALTFGAGLAAAFPIFDIPLATILDVPFTIRTVVSAAIVLYLFFAVSWVTRDLLKYVVLPRTQADPGIANTVLLVSRYTLIAVGILTAISVLGFDLSALAIIGGGLSVGIGFGLQELVANFVSGILLLFEQTLRPGDIIEVGGQRGTVSQLRMRAAVLRTIDNIEVFVPNKTLLTSTVATYTNTDRVVRRTLPVGVSYDSNPTQVRDILQSVAESHGLVLDDPAPVVFFTGFGDSSLNFEVAVWIADPVRGLQVMSDLHFMIFKEFGKHHIEIPFPQRDLHLRSSIPLDALARANGDRMPEDGAKPAPPEKQRLPLP